MTVSATARRAGPYSCNGATVSFAFSFKVFADADIQVIKTDSDGIQTVLTLTTHYTVSRNADQENNPGGTITTVATYATGNTITIIGAVAYTQTANITNAGGFFPEVVENALDRVTILTQQLKELFARVISFPASDSSPSGELVTAANRASKWLAFDASGNPIASVTTPASTTVSAFMATVLDDASALAARTTMGIGTGDSPTFTGVTTSGAATIGTNATVGGTLGVTGVATFTVAPVLTALTASRAVFTDASKALTSNAMTGTGNVVMSASPTLTGTAVLGAATLSGTLIVNRVSAQGDSLISADYSGTSYGFYAYACSNGGFSGAATGVTIGTNSGTGRSINAGGTVNASGADYAEYERKASDCGEVAKGQIIGFDERGEVTDLWARAKSFGVKTTNPAYVGGDTWGSEDALEMKMPRKKERADPVPEDGEGKQNFEQRLRKHKVDVQADEAEHELAKERFDARLETARQKVDRIAYSGKVPVNVQGANVGDYIIPVQDGDGIAGKSVESPTFDQYRIAVGQVRKILPDGRAQIAVKVG